MSKLSFDSIFDSSSVKETLDAKKEALVASTKEEIQPGYLEAVEITDVQNVYLDEDVSECDVCEVDTDESEEALKEARVVYRVNSYGQRSKKIKCPPGNRVATVNGVKKCVGLTGAERTKKRLAIQKQVRTKKAKGNTYSQRMVMKRKHALGKRKALGLGTTHTKASTS